MTTLPQTTPIRLPRIAGSSQLAVPSGTAPAVVAAPGMQMTAGDVWRVIRANFWLMVVLVGASAVAGYFVNGYLAAHDSTYSSYGLIRIRPLQPIDPLHGSGPMDSVSLDIAQQTQAQMIRSDGLIDDILKESDNPIRQTNWWKVQCGADPQKAHQLLTEHMSVEPQMGSELIRVVVTTPDKADAPVLVSSIVDRAIQNQKSDNQSHDSADRKRIADLRDRNQAALSEVNNQVRVLADEINSQGGSTTGGAANPKDVELRSELDRNITLQNEKVTAENAYNALKGQLDRGETPGQVQQMVEKDQNVQEYTQARDNLDIAITMQGADNNEHNPRLVELKKQRAVYQNKLDNLMVEKSAQYAKTMLDGLDATRGTTGQLLEQSNSQITSLKLAIADLANKTAAYESKREDQAVYRDFAKQYDQALTQMDDRVQLADFGSLAWAVRPLEPNSPSFPKLSTTMLAAVLSGLLLSMAIAFLREVTDTTVRSPRDIVRVGQMTLLGMVPHESDDPQSSGARLPLVIFEAPQSIMAEQLRQVRTRLQHAASLDTTRSILVTSASPGDGKSTIACNLAAGLALNGRRILLVDANFRRPELHRIFGVGNEVGFSDVLNDVNAFASAVRETSVPNLSVLPSGSKPSNGTELLESQLLLDVIERALEEYDHVIFDSGPMLFVSESVALAPRVDGVITVVRARSSSRGVLQRMREGLRQVKAEHLGVVLNGVRTQKGGYYGRSIKTYYEYQNQA